MKEVQESRVTRIGNSPEKILGEYQKYMNQGKN